MRKLFLVLILILVSVPAAAEWARGGLFGADVRSLVIDPEDPDRMFLGTSHGEIYLTENGALSWTNPRGSIPFPGYVVDDLLLNRKGELWMSGWGVWGGGVIAYSPDAGKSWERRDAGLENVSIRALAISPSDPDFMVAGGLEGVWRSTDAGRNWTQISSRENVESLAIDPRTDDRIFVGTWRQAWRTDDGGESWKHIAEGMVLDTDVFAIDIDPDNPDDIWLSTCGWVYNSKNRGDAWTRYREGFENRRIHATARDAENPSCVYAGSVAGLYRTLDGGRNWSRISDDRLVINSVAIHPERPDRIVLGTEGDGVYVSSDRGKTFERRSKGLHNVRVGSIVTDPFSADRVYAVVRLAGSSSGIYVSEDRGRNWSRMNRTPLPEVLTLVATKGEGPRFLAGTDKGFFHSMDGEEWTRSEPSTISIRVEKILRTGRRQAFAATSEGVFTTRDGGRSWFRIGQPDARVLDLGLARHHGSVALYALTESSLARLTDGGWKRIEGSPGGVRLVVVNRGGDQVFLVARTKTTRAGRVDRSDGWREIESGIPSGATVHLADGARSLLFFSSDASRHLSWARSGEPFSPTGLPLNASEITRITADPRSPERLYLGTMAAGLFVFDPSRSEERDQRLVSKEPKTSPGTK